MDNIFNILDFADMAKNKGLYLVPETEITKLISTSIDGYGNDYPLLQWFDQGGDGRSLQNVEMHPKGWKSTWKANILSQWKGAIIIADSPEINAWIMWMHPHIDQYSSLTWIMNGGFSAMLHMGVGEMLRFDGFEKFAVGKRNEYAYDAYYLYNLVVRRDQQGKGLGSRLMKLSMEFMDMYGYRAYLETHKSVNISIYKKYGFKLINNDCIPGTVIQHNSMLR